MTRIRSKLPPKPTDDEVWLITKPTVVGVVPWLTAETSLSGQPVAQIVPTHELAWPILVLLGFHPRTKALLHTYGPFSPEELLTFAAEHGITLPLPTPPRSTP